MSNQLIRRAQLMTGCATILLLAAPAVAQDAVTPPAAAQRAVDAARPVQYAAADMAAPAAETEAVGLTDIVVTATKRETNLQRTPIAINVLNTQAIKDRHVQSLFDLGDGAIPSLRIAPFEARQSALTLGIRGIVPLDANQPAREQGVGVYVDGVYLGRQHGLNAALFDVERIEVLKGPQGTLFGRNTEGGALSIVTKGPSGKFGGRVSGSIGNYGSYNSEAHLDLPEFHGFSVKLDGVIQHQDAITKNPLAGQTGWGYYDRQAFRAAVRWQPTPEITNDFSYDNGRDSNSPFYSQLLNFNPNNCVAGTQAASPNCALPGTSYTALTGTVKPVLPGVVIEGDKRQKVADIGVPQQPSVDKTHGFTNSLKWKVTPDLELRSITAWRGVTATQWDNSGGAHRPPIVSPGCTGTACNFSRYSLANLSQDQFSQELQAVGSLGTVDYVAGLFYFNERVSDDAATPNSLAIQGYTTAGQTTGYQYVVLDPCLTIAGVGAGSQPGCRSIDRASAVKSKSYAAYGQATWNVTDRLHLTAGGRYTSDKKKGALLFSRNVNYVTNPVAAAANGYTPLDETWNRFNPMATVAFDFSDTLHGYAKYATGYRAGGASSRTSNYQAFDPEDVKSYEVGLKADLFDRRVRINLAGYIMDRKDSQVDISTIQFQNNSSFNNLVTINAAGTTKIRGIEADVTVNPVEGLTLNASYAYTYTNIPLVPIVNIQRNAAGVETSRTTVLQRFYIVYTPRNAASGAIDYELPVGGGDTKLRFHLDANYSQATQAFDQFATKNDASFLMNGRISLADIAVGNGDEKLTVAVWGRNLLDKDYVFRRDPSNSLPGAPTTNILSGSVNNVLGDYGNFNAPRTYGIEATVRF
ncbi:TonB-dependent receptor [Sphingomonas solaris]|uniref:TonB-dependent receptor n=1 Tax=Alterirhizorhabdus solaris TaxID=2529389 RepID=A0A558QTR9_9SPHN|nr:TonB-dependent receptor [Sphingomonas solaris]TVV70540.1 TonB-dependent receptor [Sphingomonas solaris]